MKKRHVQLCVVSLVKRIAEICKKHLKKSLRVIFYNKTVVFNKMKGKSE